MSFLRDLNKRGEAEVVISLFEHGRVANTAEAMGEYVKALAKVDRLDNTALLQTLQRGMQAVQRQAPSFAARGAEAGYGGGISAAASRSAAGLAAQAEPAAAAGLGAAAAGAGGAALAAGLGTARNPLYMMQVGKQLSQLLGLAAGLSCRGWLLGLEARCSPASRPPVAALQLGEALSCHLTQQGPSPPALAAPEMQAEPTFWAQLWRTVRMLGLAFLLMAGLGAMVEERGLSRSILNNPDMR